MSNASTPNESKAHCNSCGHSTNHVILHSENQSKDQDEFGHSTIDEYEMLKCCGCGSVKLRNTTFHDGDRDEEGSPICSVYYYPQAKFRPHPRWYFDLFLETSLAPHTIHDLLGEIYIAIQNDQRALAAMGIRALLENIMIEKVGDKQSFGKNTAAFQDAGYVSRIQRERLDTILDAGHAAIHRLYKPSEDDLITLIDLAESIVESVYIHGRRVDRLKTQIPPRPAKA